MMVGEIVVDITLQLKVKEEGGEREIDRDHQHQNHYQKFAQ